MRIEVVLVSVMYCLISVPRSTHISHKLLMLLKISSHCKMLLVSKRKGNVCVVMLPYPGRMLLHSEPVVVKIARQDVC